MRRKYETNMMDSKVKVLQTNLPCVVDRSKMLNYQVGQFSEGKELSGVSIRDYNNNNNNEAMVENIPVLCQN